MNSQIVRFVIVALSAARKRLLPKRNLARAIYVQPSGMGGKAVDQLHCLVHIQLFQTRCAMICSANLPLERQGRARTCTYLKGNLLLLPERLAQV